MEKNARANVLSSAVLFWLRSQSFLRHRQPQLRVRLWSTVGIVKSEFVADPPRRRSITPRRLSKPGRTGGSVGGRSRERGLERLSGLPAMKAAAGAADGSCERNSSRRRAPLSVLESGPVRAEKRAIAAVLQNWTQALKTGGNDEDLLGSWPLLVQTQSVAARIIGPARTSRSNFRVAAFVRLEHGRRWLALHMERTPDFGKTWTLTEVLIVRWNLAPSNRRSFCITADASKSCAATKQKCVVESWSKESGKIWSPLR